MNNQGFDKNDGCEIRTEHKDINNKNKQMIAEIKIEDDAMKLIQQCVTELICFITSDITEEMKKEGRVNIRNFDVIDSFARLGFTHYLPALQTLSNRITLHQNYKFS